MAPSMLSPPQSSVASTVAHTTLPHPRSNPLKSGGAKESAFIRFVDQGILKIQRRYALQGDIGQVESADEKGYENFVQVAKDIDRLVDLIWVSGTRKIVLPPNCNP
jgi:hypothetical protein